MTEGKKEGNKVSKTNNSTNGNSRFNGTLTRAEAREKPFVIPQVDSEGPVEEMHWMAYAAYNQSK